jgi:modulator of FtsH protease
MGLVAVSAGLFALRASLGRNASHQWGWQWFIAVFVCLLGINFTVQRSEQTAVGMLFGFGVLIGLAVAPNIGY